MEKKDVKTVFLLKNEILLLSTNEAPKNLNFKFSLYFYKKNWKIIFYTEKKTLNWISIAVIMFVQVTFTYPERNGNNFNIISNSSPCK